MHSVLEIYNGDFTNPICFPIIRSRIRLGRSMGSVQSLKRRGTTA